MSAAASITPGRDGRLWAIALALSLAVNFAALGLLGLAALRSERLQARRPAPPPPPPETTVVILQAPAPASPAPPVAEAALEPKFARTAADQAAERPNRPTFIGERDTVATSDRAADAAAPPLPAQSGVEPRNPEDFETTESDYQDGELAAETPAPEPALEDAAETPPAEAPAAAAASAPPPGRPLEQLATSSAPVDVPVRAAETPAEPAPEPPAEAAAPAARPKPVADPAFAGFQRKTAIVGSISRSGRSALDVADSPLGRYQAAIGRAVELEWQRNCVRHRDFITPGYLTVRFFVEPTGRVKSVHFVGQMETGEVQKGFTLNSIREAKIPPMPPAVKREFQDAPLELLFNFYF